MSPLPEALAISMQRLDLLTPGVEDDVREGLTGGDADRRALLLAEAAGSCGRYLVARQFHEAPDWDPQVLPALEPVREAYLRGRSALEGRYQQDDDWLPTHADLLEELRDQHRALLVEVGASEPDIASVVDLLDFPPSPDVPGPAPGSAEAGPHLGCVRRADQILSLAWFSAVLTCEPVPFALQSEALRIARTAGMGLDPQASTVLMDELGQEYDARLLGSDPWGVFLWASIMVPEQRAALLCQLVLERKAYGDALQPEAPVQESASMGSSLPSVQAWSRFFLRRNYLSLFAQLSRLESIPIKAAAFDPDEVPPVPVRIILYEDDHQELNILLLGGRLVLEWGPVADSVTAPEGAALFPSRLELAAMDPHDEETLCWLLPEQPPSTCEGVLLVFPTHRLEARFDAAPD